MTSLALIILMLTHMVPTGATNSTPTTQGYLLTSNISDTIIMIKYDLQSCTKFAQDQSILWPRRGWSTQLWGSSEYSSTVSSCLCSTERGITWSTASMSWFGLSIYSPEPTSCLIDEYFAGWILSTGWCIHARWTGESTMSAQTKICSGKCFE